MIRATLQTKYKDGLSRDIYVELDINDFVEAYKTAREEAYKRNPYLSSKETNEYGFERSLYEVYLTRLSMDYKYIEFTQYYEQSSYYDYSGTIVEYNPQDEELFKPLMEFIKSTGGKDGRIDAPIAKRLIVTGCYSVGD